MNGPFRLLLAELPQYLSKHHDALDRLYALLAIVRKVQFSRSQSSNNINIKRIGP